MPNQTEPPETLVDNDLLAALDMSEADETPIEPSEDIVLDVGADNDAT